VLSGDSGETSEISWTAPDEADAFARESPDQALLYAVVADRGAGRVHAAAERRFRDDAAVPDRGEQVVAADHAIPSPDEELQYVEDLGLDRDKTVALAQLAPVGIKDEVCEPVKHLGRS